MRTIQTTAASFILLLQLCIPFQTKAQDTTKAESYSVDGLKVIELCPELGKTIDQEELKKYNINRSKYGLTPSVKFDSGKMFASAQILQRPDTSYISRVIMQNGSSKDYPVTKKELKRFLNDYFPSAQEKEYRRGRRIVIIGGSVLTVVVGFFVGLNHALSNMSIM